jgi:diacylglycerol O-acyltransferase
MTSYAYDRLSVLDYSFLALEQPNSYMHVASTQILEAGPMKKPGGGIDAEAFKKLTEGVLHRIPRYRQRLAFTPIDNHPVWVDDDRFNIDYHIRHTSLPHPGTEEQLKRLSARIMQQHLDRSRPLWELWLVEGLEGDRFAVISKVHHCMVDGVSGVDLMNILMSPTPEAVIHEPPAYLPRPAPSPFVLLRDEIRHRLALPFSAMRGVRSFVREAQDLRRELAVRARAITEALGGNMRRPSRTPLNRKIGPHRRFDWLTMDLAEVKMLRRSLGGSLNDVVLTIVNGAVRSFLLRRRVDLEEIDFRIMAPVSVRTEEQKGALGNSVSAWIVPLPIAEEDPRVALAQISARTNELKESKSAIAAGLLTQVAEWGSSTLLALGARNMTRLLPFNMVVTNVPGPQVPLYTLGSRMLECYPHVPLTDRLGLGIALMSYNGKLCWGFNADYDLVPDLDDFLDDVRASFEALRVLAEDARPTPTLEAAETDPIAAPESTQADKSRWKGAVSAARAAAEAGGLTEDASGSNGTESGATPTTH